MTSTTQPAESEASEPPVAPVHLRADAARNRERILTAADEVFAADGLAVPVDEIARRAGVGAGTLYRHFPTKEALFEAVVMRDLETMTAEARELCRDDDAGAALFGYMRRMARHAARRRNLYETLAGIGIDVKARAGERKADLEAAIGELLRRAQVSGAARADVTFAELMTLVVGVCSSADPGPAACQERVMDVICDGLRAPAAGAP